MSMEDYEHGKEREKNMGEGDHGLWTAECLRGRLLTERVASKAAKEDAEFMGNKLIELEAKLKVEMEAKNKAEKRLKILMEKMNSLELSPISSHSKVFRGIEGSPCSSKSSSNVSAPEEESNISCAKELVHCSREMGESIDSTLTSEDLGNTKSERSIMSLSHQSSCSIGANSDWSDTNNSCNIDTGNHPPSEIKHHSKTEFLVDYPRQIMTGNEIKLTKSADNTLALIPTSVLTKPKVRKPHTKKHNVNDVLAALRRLKEQLQNSQEGDGVTKYHSVVLCSRA